jgi:hypothetical protein
MQIYDAQPIVLRPGWRAPGATQAAREAAALGFKQKEERANG